MKYNWKTLQLFMSLCACYFTIQQVSGPCLNMKIVFFPGIGIFIIKIKWLLWDCLIFIMGIPILLRWHVFIEIVSWESLITIKSSRDWRMTILFYCHTEARTKWLPFYRQHILIYFHEWNHCSSYCQQYMQRRQKLLIQAFIQLLKAAFEKSVYMLFQL